MEALTQFITENADYAHWIIFGSLILAGFNVPISEDVMVISSALIAATVLPEKTFVLFTFAFLGCYISDWISYWLGRTLGRKLWKMKWFKKTIHPKRVVQAQNFYDKYGFLTLLVGRFIPFGVRNGLFFTAGIGKMPFGRFLLSDGIACIISNSTLFYIAFVLGQNYQVLLRFLKTFNIAIFFTFVVTLIVFICYKRKKKNTI